jgi:hypothetical protein
VYARLNAAILTITSIQQPRAEESRRADAHDPGRWFDHTRPRWLAVTGAACAAAMIARGCGALELWRTDEDLGDHFLVQVIVVQHPVGDKWFC